MKATTTAQSGSTASRAPRQEGIIKEAIGLTDVKTLRAQARQGIEDGAMTAGYKAKVGTVIRLLNEALATEIVCVLRYKRHYFMASGINSLGVKAEFLQHAIEEQTHADQLAERIIQLGGEPNLSLKDAEPKPFRICRDSLVEMITEDLVAEQLRSTVIEKWSPMSALMIPTRKYWEDSRAEEEHAEDLASLLKKLDP